MVFVGRTGLGCTRGDELLWVLHLALCHTVYMDLKDKRDQKPLEQLPQCLSKARTPSARVLHRRVPFRRCQLCRGGLCAVKEEKEPEPPAHCPGQLFPIDPGRLYKRKNREQKVGENPSFQGKEGNDQENRKASLVPNTQRPDLTNLPAASPAPATGWPPRHGDRWPLALFVPGKGPWNAGEGRAVSFVLAQRPSICWGGRRLLPPQPPAPGPLAGLTALAHVAAASPGQTMGWRGLPHSPRKAFLLLLLLPAPLQRWGEIKK